RSASSCAASSSPANTSSSVVPTQLPAKERHDERKRSRADRARRLSRRGRSRARARRRDPRSAAAQHRVDAAARSAAPAFGALGEDARVRVILLRAGGEHFSSGGDIRGFLAASPEHVSKLAWNIAAPARCGKPVIAANRGFCFGVGFELSLACDFRIVSETCFYAPPAQLLRPDPGAGGAAPPP